MPWYYSRNLSPGPLGMWVIPKPSDPPVAKASSACGRSIVLVVVLDIAAENVSTHQMSQMWKWYTSISCAPPIAYKTRRRIREDKYVNFDLLLLDIQKPPLLQSCLSADKLKQHVTDLPPWLRAWTGLHVRRYSRPPSDGSCTRLSWQCSSPTVHRV